MIWISQPLRNAIFAFFWPSLHIGNAFWPIFYCLEQPPPPLNRYVKVECPLLRQDVTLLGYPLYFLYAS